MIVTNQFNYLKAFKASVVIYLPVSLVFSVTVVIQLLRHYKIDPTNMLVIRGVVILGAIVSVGIWFIILYPISWLNL